MRSDDEKPINLDIVASNIMEAREELEKLERLIEDHELDEVELRIGLQHALHHLNFAWNIRHQSTERYASQTIEDFEDWGKHPEELNWPP